MWSLSSLPLLLLLLLLLLLQNTTSFKTDHLSWLVLDEADRLLDLGFEAKLKAIIAKFDARSSSGSDSGSDGGRRRQTALLSATLHPGLSELAGLSLQEPVGVGFKAKVVDGQLQLAAESGGAAGAEGQQQEGGDDAFELPQQLKQKYVEVDAKMRLVNLVGEWGGGTASGSMNGRVGLVVGGCGWQVWGIWMLVGLLPPA